MAEQIDGQNAQTPDFTPEQLHEIEMVEAAIADLWDLKKYLIEIVLKSETLNFDALLRKETYRNQVLEKLAKVKSPDIAGLANKLSAMNLLGSVHIDDVKKRMRGLNQANSGAGSITQEILETKLAQTVNTVTEQLQSQFSKQLAIWKSVSAFMTLIFASLTLNLLPFVNDMMGNKVIELSGSIQSDTVFRADNTYILREPVFVEGKTTLTIEAGTTIFVPGSALIITRDAQLIAKGNKESPIIFTSNKSEGQRNRGDWGGLVLLGNAPVNRKGQLEGIDRNDPAVSLVVRIHPQIAAFLNTFE